MTSVKIRINVFPSGDVLGGLLHDPLKGEA
jgi:hypothetical protein